MKDIELGNKVRDKVTGLEGIAMCKCIYLNGCIQYEVQPKVNDKGEMVKGLWVDLGQLEYLEAGLVLMPLEIEEPPGGGQRNHSNE